MMKLIIIHSDDNGVIGVAKNTFSAIKWLIDSRWLTEDYDVWSVEKRDWAALKTLCSISELVKMTKDEFNTFFEGSFYLEEDYLIDYNIIK